jgi:eukaryotic-like serine/threonine-protein kinase
MQQTAKNRIRRHEIICPLGEGGMAQVYLACSRGPADVNKLVVLKQIRSELARDKRFVTMFFDEARLATRLSHPNVVHTYEALEDAGRYILTMEYLEGQSLFDVLQRIDLQYFPLDLHLWILTQVLAGLQYAHAVPDYDGSPLGIVHRDVSPENTFLTYNGDVKLLDFGIAKAGGAVSVTYRGMFKGKLAYCAPEQIEGDESPDARADIFAVGVMLWEALAGRRIEARDTCSQLAQARRTGKEPRIRQVRPDVPPALADMCDRAMALRPSDRYLSAVDFQRDLERYLEESGRRPGRAQLAELMRGHFEIERRSIRKQIQEHLYGATKPRIATPGAMLGLTPGWGASSRESRRRAIGLAPPALWASKSFAAPGTFAASVLPIAAGGTPTEPRRRLTGVLLVVVAVLFGGGVAAVGPWKGQLRASPRAPVFTQAPPSTPLPSRPSESPQQAPTGPIVTALSPTPKAAVVEAARAASVEEKPLHVSHLRLRVGKKARLARPASHESTQVHQPKSSPAQAVTPGMDLGSSLVARPSEAIDEINPYASTH